MLIAALFGLAAIAPPLLVGIAAGIGTGFGK